MPIDVHSPGQSPPDLLGSEATVRLDQVIQERTLQTNKSLLDIAKAGARSFAANKQGQGQKKSQKKAVGQSRRESMEYKSPLPDTQSNTSSFQSGTSTTNNNKPGGGPKRAPYYKKGKGRGKTSNTQSKPQ
jgi:hypothetical protein